LCAKSTSSAMKARAPLSSPLMIPPIRYVNNSTL
jgi:hypothetical protein